MYQRIVVPLDGSETAALAVQHAQALAQKFGS
ncbi:MAG TPA: universal stress protein, partial [Dehalococcoidia bacterium]